jgi:hypothetical protein
MGAYATAQQSGGGSKLASGPCARVAHKLPETRESHMPQRRPPTARPHPVKSFVPKPKAGAALVQLDRIRRFCAAYPETLEKLSHGEPTFFARNKVFVMFDDHHHGADHIAAWLPAPSGVQDLLLEQDDSAYFRPPYVGSRGWIGVRLDQVDDARLAHHIRTAWLMVAPKTLQKQLAP